ncbi:MAG: hypothetical protein HY920_09160, partial [Elusimicrobia bacterium]|nr:hypothetical protein [Elusimicrobiota bacterium]
MVSEEVIYKDGQFNTTFEFFNTSNKEQEVTIGFPVVGDFQFSGDTFDIEPKNEIEKLQKISDYYKFKSFINGKEVERTLTKLSKEFTNDGYDYVFITKLKFTPLQKIVVKNVYNQSEISSATSAGGGGESSISYILETGALWKDKIKNARIVFYLDADCYDTFVFCPGFYGCGTQFQKNYFTSTIAFSKISKKDKKFEYEWIFKNWEPKENLSVSWGSKPTSIYEITPIDSNKLLGDINKISDKYKNFFVEMQNSNTLYRYVIALTECKLFAPTEQFERDWGMLFGDLKINSENDQREIDTRFLINSLYALKGYKFNKP